MAAQSLTPFAWGEIELSETILIDGVPHATKTAIGEWLDYADPRDAINKIIERNQHLRRWSTAVKLTAVDGKNRDTEVYHPVGFLLIVMESGQPRAHAMKQAVAEFVHQYVGRQELSFRETDALQKRRLALLDRLNKTKDAFVQAALLSDLRDVSLCLGVAVPNVALLGTDAKQLALEV
jgi:prophage antirepressor-like protein